MPGPYAYVSNLYLHSAGMDKANFYNRSERIVLSWLAFLFDRNMFVSIIKSIPVSTLFVVKHTYWYSFSAIHCPASLPYPHFSHIKDAKSIKNIVKGLRLK